MATSGTTMKTNESEWDQVKKRVILVSEWNKICNV